MVRAPREIRLNPLTTQKLFKAGQSREMQDRAMHTEKDLIDYAAIEGT